MTEKQRGLLEKMASMPDGIMSCALEQAKAVRHCERMGWVEWIQAFTYAITKEGREALETA